MSSGTPAVLSPSFESHANAGQPRGQSLHSHFNPKLVGFGISPPFEATSTGLENWSQNALIQTSYSTDHPEILK
jgi:hypothetical protein